MKRKRWAVLLYPHAYELIKEYIDRTVEDYKEPECEVAMKAVIYRTKGEAQREAVTLAYWQGLERVGPVWEPIVEAI